MYSAQNITASLAIGDSDEERQPRAQYIRKGYLPENFEYYPATLHDTEAYANANSPAWAHCIKSEALVHALQIAESELEELTASGDASDIQRGCCESQLACTYLSLGQSVEAEVHFRAAFGLLKANKSEVRDDFLCLSGVWAQCMIELGRPDDVMSTLLEMKELYLNGSFPTGENNWALTLFRAIDLCYKSNLYDLADELYKEAVEFYKITAGEDSQDYIDTLGGYSEFLYGRGDLEDCSENFSIVRAWYEANGQNSGTNYTRACIRGAQCAVELGEPVEALLLVRLASKNLDPQDDLYTYMKRDCLIVRAKVAYQRGILEAMCNHFEAAIQTLDQGEDCEIVAILVIEDYCQALAELRGKEREEYWLRNHMTRCEKHYGADSPELLRSHEMLCSFLDRSGQHLACFKETGLYVERCKRMFGDRSPQHIDSLCEYASTHFSVGRGEQGEHLLVDLLKIARETLKSADRRLILKIIETASVFHGDKGEIDITLHERKVAERLAKLYDGDGSMTHAQALLGLASIYLQMDELTLCQAAAEQALMITEAGGKENSSVVSALELLGAALIEDGDLEGAELHLTQAHEILDRQDALKSADGVRILGELGTCIFGQTAIIPDRARQQQALAFLMQADQIQEDIGGIEGPADCQRKLAINALARSLGFEPLVEQTSLCITRMINSGIEIDGWGDEEGANI